MQKTQFPVIVLASCAIVYIVGLFIPLMEVDAAQYASISREMLANKSYLQVYDIGRDYLDKPPMLFWLSAGSMRIFGVHGWSYRLPSLLFCFLAIYSTYRLALIFYKKEIAVLSALVLASSQAIFLINHDVRTDTMLMGWVALSIWQFAAWFANGRWPNFLLAFAAIAGGMMTKGPIALMVPVFAFVPHFLLRREWKQFFRWEYLAGIALIGVLLIPMSIGLYEQYDLHPGKIVHGVPIRSGLRFFFWTQSFGRITGESEWKENGSFFFLLQNMLWSFLPWIIFFLAALFIRFRDLLRNGFRLNQSQEFITAGGFVLTYCSLASSQAQLPHYIFIVFPLASVVTAVFLYKLFYTHEFTAWKKPLFIFHGIVFILLWVALLTLLSLVFTSIPRYVPVLALFVFGGMVLLLFRPSPQKPKWLYACFYTVIGINFFLNTAFYPALLQYQAGNTAADFINRQHLDINRTYVYGMQEGKTLDFYAQHIFRHRTAAEIAVTDVLVMPLDSVPGLRRQWPDLKILHTGPDYHVSTLSLPFLNPATRGNEFKKYAIVTIGDK